MRVLIIEDNTFNAFCLTRLFEAICKQAQVSVVTDSIEALSTLEAFNPHLVILDGDLGAGDGCYCNGPVLADLILRQFPNKALVAWTDNEPMRQAFADVFKTHQKPFNDTTIWSKIMCHNKLYQILAELASEYDMGYFWQSSGSLHLERLYA